MRPLLALRDWRAPRCPYCRESIERAQPTARCEGCETLIHAACADELGGCSTLGCVAQRVSPTAAARVQQDKAAAPATPAAARGSALDELAELAVRIGGFGTVILLPAVVVCLVVTLQAGGWAQLRLFLECLPELLEGVLGWLLCLGSFPAALLLGLTLCLARRRSRDGAPLDPALDPGDRVLRSPSATL